MSSEARRQPLSRRQRPDRVRPEPNPVKVLEDVLGSGFEETCGGKVNRGEKGAAARRARSGFFFKSAAQLLGSSRPSGRLALINHDPGFDLCAPWRSSRSDLGEVKREEMSISLGCE